MTDYVIKFNIIIKITKGDKEMLTRPKTSTTDNFLKSKLAEALMHRLSLKYKDVKGAEPVIWRWVNKVMASHSKLTEPILKELDKNIFDTLHAPPATKPVKPKEPLIRPATSRNTKDFQRKTQRHLRLQHTTTSKAQRNIEAIVNEERQWCEIVRFNTMLHEEFLNQERIRKQREKEELKNALLQQIKEKEQMKRTEANELKAYLCAEMETQRQWKEKEQDRKIVGKNMALKRNKELLRQCLEKRRQQFLDNKSEKNMELKLLERCKTELKRDEWEKLERRKLEREYMLNHITESEAKRNLAKTQEVKMKESEKKELEEYLRGFDKLEQEKRDEKLRRTLDVNKEVKMARESTTLLKAHMRKTERDWFKKLLDQEIARNKLEEAERLKALRRVQSELRQFYDTQVSQKKVDKQKETEQKWKEAEEVQDLTKTYKADQMNYKTVYKNACVSNARYLQEQMKEHDLIKKSRTFAYFHRRKKSEGLIITGSKLYKF